MEVETENRRAVEALTTAFETLAAHARQKHWLAEHIADAAFRSAVMLHLDAFGLQRTAAALAHLADDLRQLAKAGE